MRQHHLLSQSGNFVIEMRHLLEGLHGGSTLRPGTYDVHAEGGGGFRNSLILQTTSTDRLREMQTSVRGV